MEFKKLKSMTAFTIKTIAGMDTDGFVMKGEIPAGESIGRLLITKMPYGIEFTMEDGAYKHMCKSLGFAPVYGCYTDGMCTLLDNRSTTHKKIKGSLILMKAYQVDGTTEIAPNPITKRHEELHAYQNVMKRAFYAHPNIELEQDLLNEEAAICISTNELGSNGTRPLLTHTRHYLDLGIPHGDFEMLANRVYPDGNKAQKLIDQRKRNEYALASAYAGTDKLLVGWTLHLLNFWGANKVLETVPAVYQSM